MAKMASLSGAVTGKLAGNVYSVNAGQQIVRAYQPNVANPSTELQVQNRTKFKLASQLAATVSPVLAIAKNGMVSGRNQFVRDSMDAITYSLDEATILLNRIQLTKSSIELPTLIAARGTGNTLEMHVSGDATLIGVTKIVYAVFIESAINKLQLIYSEVGATAGSSGRFPVTISSASNRALYCYAYGIIEEDDSLLTKYGSYNLDNAQFVASLLSSRSGTAPGLKTTITKYAYVEAAQ